jgi:hypothetical protein
VDEEESLRNGTVGASFLCNYFWTSWWTLVELRTNGTPPELPDFCNFVVLVTNNNCIMSSKFPMYKRQYR